MLAYNERTVAPREHSTHPAKPTKGEVNYAALRRDLKVKFAKTVSFLAK